MSGFIHTNEYVDTLTGIMIPIRSNMEAIISITPYLLIAVDERPNFIPSS